MVTLTQSNPHKLWLSHLMTPKHSNTNKLRLPHITTQTHHDSHTQQLPHTAVSTQPIPTCRNLHAETPNRNHTLRTQTNKPLDLKIPLFKSRAGTSSSSFQGPTLWNNVSTENRGIDQRGRFKTAIKSIILNEYEQKASCTNPRCRDHSNHSHE